MRSLCIVEAVESWFPQLSCEFGFSKTFLIRNKDVWDTNVYMDVLH